METGICRKCGIEKELCEFDFNLKRKNGYSTKCKECRREYHRDYKLKNPEKTKERTKKFYWDNHEKELNRSREKHIRFKDNEVEYRKKNRKLISEREKLRYQNDHLYRLKVNLRNRTKLFLKSNEISKTNSTFDIVGADSKTIKDYIEKQFTEGMTWENYGYYGWHIDHKIPLSSAKTVEEVYKLCHYTNLQPMWSYDNFKKSSKII
jgi:hypothetical protein